MNKSILDKPIVILGLLLLMTFVLYLPALKAEFILDGHYVIENNPVTKQADLWKTIFERKFFDAYKASFHPELNYYRPITLLSFVWNDRLLGHGAFGYRLINVGLHAFNSFLLFLFLTGLFKKKAVALYAAILFAILPVQEWAVNYEVGRGDLLQAFFLLLSSISLVSYLSRPRILLLFISLISFLLALLSREAALLYPLFVAVIVFCFYKQQREERKTPVTKIDQYLASSNQTAQPSFVASEIVRLALPYVIIAVLYYFLREVFFPLVNIKQPIGLSDLGQWIALSIQYQVRFIFPWAGFWFAHYLIENIFFDVAVLFSFIGLIYLWIMKRKPEEKAVVYFGWGWLLCSWLFLWPTRNSFAKQGPYLAEHFLYFSSIGFSVLVACAVSVLKEKKQQTYTFLSIGLFYGSIIFFANTHWTTEKRLLQHVFSLENRKEAVAYRQLLYRYGQNIDDVKAMIAKSDRPTERALWTQKLGSLYRSQGHYPEAIDMFRRVIEMDPNNLEAVNELAVCYLETNDYAKGKEYLTKVVELDPENGDAYRLLGEAAYHHGEFFEASKNLEKALFYQPDHETIIQFLAMSYFLSGNKPAYVSTVDSMDKNVRDVKGALKFFAREFYQHRYFAQAIEVLQGKNDVLERDEALLNILGWSYLQTGDDSRAKEIFKYILTINPKNVDALLGMTKTIR
jgi:tetratricopeptide (TPR) repeat protein